MDYLPARQTRSPNRSGEPMSGRQVAHQWDFPLFRIPLVGGIPESGTKKRN